MKTIKRNSLICCFMVIMCIISLSLFSFKIDSVSADVTGKSGFEYVLTGYNGYQPRDYFTDDSNVSTLVNSEVEPSDKNYYNADGEETNEFYAVQGASKGTSKRTASGISGIDLTADMISVANTGVLYAQASAGLLALKDNNRSKLTIKVYSGDNSASAMSHRVDNDGDVYSPEWINTGYINVNPSGLKFSFQANDVSNNIYLSKFMMFEPSIQLKTSLSTLDLSVATTALRPGAVVKLNPVSAINSLTGTSEYINYLKAYHKISYEIEQAEDYVYTLGNYLYISQDCPSNYSFSIKAKCKKDLTTDEIIYSQDVDLIVDARMATVRVKSNFINPAKFMGAGIYYVGQNATITVETYEDYIFQGWLNVNGEIMSTEPSLSFTVFNDVLLKPSFIKKIEVRGCSIAPKVYDGTDIASDYSLKLIGVDDGDMVAVSSVSLRYADANVGENKVMTPSGTPILIGFDSAKYVLKSQIVSDCFGTILPKQVKITPNATQKQYGESEPIIQYVSIGVVSGQTLNGSLSRVEGEDVGDYDINLGNMEQKNPNYKLSLEESLFTIKQRSVGIAFLSVTTKNYDKSKLANSVAELSYKREGDDVRANVVVTYADNLVGTNKPATIYSIQLDGDDKNNYKLDYESNVYYGTILPRPVNVTANNVEITYGQAYNLTYNHSEMLYGDSLSGALIVDYNNMVGEYEIKIGTLANPNYKINYTSGLLRVGKRPVVVSANPRTKYYGDIEPELTYSASNILSGDGFDGALSRIEGETPGNYKITIGSLKNDNYSISFISSNFEIKKRLATLTLVFKDKIYDGSNKVEYSHYFENLVEGDSLIVDASIVFETINVGNGIKLIANKLDIVGEDINNYEITLVSNNMTASITKRDVYVSFDSFEKVYGEDDPEFVCKLENVVNDDNIIYQITRINNEDCGQYLLQTNELNSNNYPNYNFIIIKDGKLKIIPKNINLNAGNNYKYYGEVDPELTFELGEGSSLENDDKLSDILSGKLSRSVGETVGKYPYNLGTISAGKNYTINNVSGALYIQKKQVRVVVNPESKYYGEDDPVFTYSVENTIEGEDLVLNFKRSSGNNVGSYYINCVSLIDSRYQIEYVGNYLTILPIDIGVSADNKTKVFSQQDPELTVSITSGNLKYNDTLDELLSGELSRIIGEDVGVYKINIGDFNLGTNYNVVFSSGELSIIKKTINVIANDTIKYYGDDEKDLTYKIIGEGANIEDLMSGMLARETGEDIGEYAISIGSLNAGNNYTIIFESGVFQIVPRPIIIIAQPVSKIYGEDDPQLTYEIEGVLLGEDELLGGLSREKPSTLTNPLNYENVGIYKIVSSLHNDNYSITFISSNLEILPRTIKITADDKIQAYGADSVELTFNLEGEIDASDALNGGLYRVPGDNAGVYEIRSNFNLGKNYSIEYQKANYTITPIDITISADNYVKTYGDVDPIYTYEIIEGELINGDQLLGGLTREQGENVGYYRLLGTFSNTNYNVNLSLSFLKINQKEVNLNCLIQDKTFDGTTVAFIRSPIVVGLIDSGITIDYINNKSCRFFDSDVGENKPVELYDIELVGEKSKNYVLILPTDLTGTINPRTIKNALLSVSANINTVIKCGTEIGMELKNVDAQESKIYKKIITSFNVWLEKDNEIVVTNGSLKLELNIDPKTVNNVYVYKLSEDGKYSLVSSTYKNGTLSIDTNQLGEFVVVSDDENWMDITFYLSLIILSSILVIILLIIFRKKKLIKKN